MKTTKSEFNPNVAESHIVSSMGDVAKAFDVSVTAVNRDWLNYGMPTLGTGPDRTYDLYAVDCWRRRRNRPDTGSMNYRDSEALMEDEFELCKDRIRSHFAADRWISAVYEAVDHALCGGVAIHMEAIISPIDVAIRDEQEATVEAWSDFCSGQTAIVTDDGKPVWCEMFEPLAQAFVELHQAGCLHLLPEDINEWYGDAEWEPAPKRSLKVSWSLTKDHRRLPVNLQAVSDSKLFLRNQYWPRNRNSAIARLKDDFHLGLRTEADRKQWRQRVREAMKD